MAQIAIFTSGHSRGSNFLAIYNYIVENKLPISIRYLLVTDLTSPVASLASERGIPVICYADKSVRLKDYLVNLCQKEPVDLIALCGFMRKLGSAFFEAVTTPVVNIHPALLPKYGGKGMFGMNVHKAVFESGEKVSGATVHYVNEHYDAGDIICQQECDISGCGSPEEIANRVLQIEHDIYPMAIERELHQKK